MQGVRLGKDELIRRFGVGERLAVRVGALLAKKVGLTAAVLEMAAADSPVELMLVHPRLLSAAAELDTGALQTIAQETGADALGPFVVARAGDWRVIALEEESLAETGWEQTREEADAESTALTTTPTGAPVVAIRPEDAASIFSPEDLARLKLTALTSGESSARISALRQLRMAPLSPQEKGNIFLRALLDPISPARSEAVKGLEDMGFDRDTAEAIQDMFESEGHARALAIQRVGALLQGLTPSEQQIALRVLVEGLREFKSAEAQSRVLGALGEAADIIARFPQVLDETVRLALRRVADMPDRAAIRVREFLYLLAERNPEGMDRLLWRGLEPMRDANVRAFTLTLLAQLDLPDDSRGELADAMIREILRDDLDEVERQKLGHNLISFGPHALDPLMNAFTSADAGGRVKLAPLLDMLLVDRVADPRARERVARQFLECLVVAERRLRLAILHTRILSLPDLDEKLRGHIAEALASQLRATDHPDVLDRISDLIESMGQTAVQPMMEAVRRISTGPAADRMARALGRLIVRIVRQGRAAPSAKSLLALLRQRVSAPGNTAGGYALALSALAAAGAEPPEQARQDADLLLDLFGKAPYHADLIEGLGALAAGVTIDLPRKLRIIRLLGGVIESSQGDSDSAMLEIDTPDGRLYEFSAQVAFDTEALPAVIEAMETIFFSPATTDAIKGQIVSQLSRVWEKVAAWDVVWGPQSSQRLALALARIGAEAGTPIETCLSVARSMLRQVNRISVVRAMSVLFQADLEDKEFNDLAVACASAMLDRWDHPETAPEEWRIILEAAGRVAARPQLRPRSRGARDLRQRAVEMLFERLTNGLEAARAPLEWIRDCPTAPKKLRENVTQRLRKAMALIRVE